MTRLGLAPDEQFAESFRYLRAGIEEIKQAQRIGRDIMRPKIVECLDGFGQPTEYDLVSTFGIYGNELNFTATLSANHQLEPWASLFTKIYYGNPTTPISPGLAAGFFYISAGNTNPGTIAYKGRIATNDGFDTNLLYVKFYMYATDDGILEVIPEQVE